MLSTVFHAGSAALGLPLRHGASIAIAVAVQRNVAVAAATMQKPKCVCCCHLTFLQIYLNLRMLCRGCFLPAICDPRSVHSAPSALHKCLLMPRQL